MKNVSGIAIDSYSLSLVSAERKNNIADILSKTDFTNKNAVMEAHEKIVYMGLCDRFFDWAFHGGRKAEALDALATLMLHKEAGKIGVASSLRDNALTKLADLLSPSGQDALIQSVAENSVDDELSKYLTRQDQYCLAGHVYDRQYRFIEARDAYRLAGEDERAEDACEQAAEAYE